MHIYIYTYVYIYSGVAGRVDESKLSALTAVRTTLHAPCLRLPGCVVFEGGPKMGGLSLWFSFKPPKRRTEPQRKTPPPGNLWLDILPPQAQHQGKGSGEPEGQVLVVPNQSFARQIIQALIKESLEGTSVLRTLIEGSLAHR